jgi:hypothetical protein
VTRIIIMLVTNLVAPKAATKHEHLFDKLVSELQCFDVCHYGERRSAECRGALGLERAGSVTFVQIAKY